MVSQGGCNLSQSLARPWARLGRLRPSLLANLPLYSLLLLAPGSALAIGFTGSFDPSTWVVINTNPSQTLNGTADYCNKIGRAHV